MKKKKFEKIDPKILVLLIIGAFLIVALMILTIVSFTSKTGKTPDNSTVPTLSSEAAVTSIEGGTVEGLDLSLGVSQDTDNVDLSSKVSVSAGASWRLYKDAECSEEVSLDSASDLNDGENIFYITVKSESGRSSSPYKLNVFKNYEVPLNLNKNFDMAGKVSGGGNILSNSNVTVSATTNVGYTFIGWYEGDDIVSEKASYTFVMPISRRILEARWAVNRYTINFNSNGGSAVNSITQKYQTVVREPSKPSKIGYTFGGWYSDSALNTVYKFGQMGAADITLFAKWVAGKYSVNLTKNIEAAGEVSGARVYDYNSSATITATTKTGYTFIGWYEGDDIVSEKASYRFVVSNETRNLCAHWKINQHTISFDSNGGSEIADITKNYGETVFEPINAPVREGYTFGGWYSDEDLQNKYTFNKIGASDITLYAKWTVIPYTLNLTQNMDAAGTVSCESLDENNKADYNSSVTVVATVNDGYTFGGWYEGNAVVSTKLSYTFNMPAYDRTLKAVWGEKPYYVELNKNISVAGSVEGGGTKDYGENVIVKATTNPGYEFIGWYENGEQIPNVGAEYQFDMGSTVRVLEARWEINQYTITFVSNAGSVVANITQNYGETVKKPANPTREGYTFDDWYTDNVDFSTKYTFTTMPVDGITLYANWIPNPYQVTLSKNSEIAGTVTGGGVHNCGSSVTVTATPSKGYYGFDGWYENGIKIENANEEYTFAMPAHNRSLEARWLPYKRVDIDGNADSTGEYVLFGEWPQTYEPDETNVATGSPQDMPIGSEFEKYYLGIDGVTRYIKVTANLYPYGNPCKLFSDGITAIENGKDYYFKVEPIKWRILDITDNKAFIVCDSAIANKRYAETDNRYEPSEIRAWLNAQFYKTAFNDLQKVLIEKTEVDNSVASTGWPANDYASDKRTNDYIFLLSYVEVANESYFNDDSARIVKVSDYSRATGTNIYTSEDNYGSCRWYLRSPFRDDDRSVRSVYFFGDVTYVYSDVMYSADHGVVSAMWFNLITSSQYMLNLGKNIEEAGTVAGGGAKEASDSVSLVATTNSGYTFLGWYDGETRVSAEANWNFNMPADHKIYEARWELNQYYVDANRNIDAAGTVSNSGNYTYGDTVTLEATTNPGYTFLGWYDEENQKVSEEESSSCTFIMPASNRLLEARWKINQYTITFVSNEGSVVADITQNYGETVTKPANPTRAGYTFDDWYTDNVDFSTKYIFTTMPLNGITLYAKWTPNSYQVTLSKNSDIAGTVTGGGNHNCGSSVTVTATPSKGYYGFDGWYENGSKIENANEEYTFTMPAHDRNLEARWLPYKRVDIDGNADSAGEYVLFGEWPQTYEPDETIINKTTAYSMPADSEFDNYYLGNDGVTRYIKVTANPSEYLAQPQFSNGTEIIENTDYYFKVEPIKWRILNFNTLAENGNKAFLFCEDAIANKRYNEKYDGIQNEVYANNYEASEIRAWLNSQFYKTAFNILQKQLIELTLVDNSESSTGHSTNQYACQDAQSNVFLLSYQEATNPNYGFNSDGNNWDTTRVKRLTDYSLATGGDAWEGYSGWWLRSPSTIRSIVARMGTFGGFLDNGDVGMSEMGVIPALWFNLITSDQYMLTLGKNINIAGTVAGGGAKEVGDAVTLEATTKAGYTFLGWYEGDIRVSAEANWNFNMPADHKIYEARWALKQYYVDVNKNIDVAGTVSNSGNYTYGDTVTLEATTNPGYTFLGWYDEENQKVSEDGSLSCTFVMPASNRLLEARWEINQYTITFVSNEGSAVANITQNYGETVKKPTDPTRAGYTFDDWYTDNVDFSTKYTFTTMPLDGITLYAKWNINQYTVVLNKNIDVAGTVEGAGDYDYHSSVTINATTNSGWTFAGWYEGATKVSADESYTFIMETYTMIFEAVWLPYQRVDANNNPDDLFGEYILFGEFPQTKELDNGNVDTNNFIELETGHEFTRYYYGKDGVTRYVDIGGEYFKVEPIKWRILSINDGEALLLSESVIARKRYNETYDGIQNGVYANNYKASELRAWLNNQFYKTAFSELQESLIQTTSVDNSAASTASVSNPYASENTDDNVFLLSYQEARSSTYFSDNDARIKKPTDYSAGTHGSGNCYWWSRSPDHSDSKGVYGVDINGSIDAGEPQNISSVHDDSNGVVPALCFNLMASGQYMLNLSQNIDTAGTVTGGGNKYYGKSITITANTTNEGYTFDGWYDENGIKVSTGEDTSYTFTMPAYNRALEARWKVQLTVTKNMEIEETATGTGVYYPTSKVTVTATTSTGYTFAGWYKGSAKVSSSLSFSFYMPAYPLTLEAKWLVYQRVDSYGEPAPSDGSFMYFGEWPQTKELNNDNVNTTSFIELAEGSEFTRYYYGVDEVTRYVEVEGEYFKVEPIKWKILKLEEDVALVLCESIIANKQYNDTDNNKYIDSTIRGWLNDKFYKTAFSPLQKQLIEQTLVDNSAASTGFYNNDKACDDTEDNIFLLSYLEATNSSYGLDTDDTRTKQPTDYSKKTGAYASDTYPYNGNWWLRSPKPFDNDAALRVSDTGAAGGNEFIFYPSIGVVPALRIALRAPNKYMLSLGKNSNVAGTVTGGGNKNAGESVTINATTIDDGYTFLGWYEGNTRVSTEPSWTFNMPAEHKRYDAKWAIYQRIDVDGNLDENGNYILFGVYPQTRVMSPSLSETTGTMGELTYTLGTDGVTRYVEVGGEYFKVEPIKWRILSTNAGKAFILCESMIANKAYHSTNNNYESSDIRAWLNNQFYETAFSVLQKPLIETTSVDNSAQSTGYATNQFASETPTNDHIFLLSYEEVMNTAYFNSETARTRKSTDYSKKTGVNTNFQTGNGVWWLRSPSASFYYNARTVSQMGYTNYVYRVSEANRGVVPALVINLV